MPWNPKYNPALPAKETEIRVSIRSLISPAFHSLYWDIMERRNRHYWLAGGRGSGKSSFVSVIIVMHMLLDEKANAVCLRHTKSTIYDSCYKQIVWALDKFGVSREWRTMKNPMDIVNNRTGQRIIFRGTDDPAKLKSIKPSAGYFRFLWFEELTEFRGMEDVRTVTQSVARGTDDFQFFYSYNPPKSARNWTNAEAAKRSAGRRVHKSTYLDMPREWLGGVFLDEAELLKQTNERAYNNVYLGDITGTGGQVFDNLDTTPITDSEIALLDRYYYGVDFGFAVDPDALIECAYDRRSRALYITREYYASRTPTETLARAVIDIAGDSIVTCDSAEPRTINALRRLGVKNALGAKKGKDSIEHGMRWLQELGVIRVDPDRTPNAAREFAGYEFMRDRYGNFLAEYPDKDNHTIDAVRYAVESLSADRVASTLDRMGLGIY